MADDLPAIGVEQRRLGRLEHPGEAPVLGLASIDLHALGLGGQQQLGPCGRRYGGRIGLGGDGAQQAGGNSQGNPAFSWQLLGILVMSEAPV